MFTYTALVLTLLSQTPAAPPSTAIDDATAKQADALRSAAESLNRAAAALDTMTAAHLPPPASPPPPTGTALPEKWTGTAGIALISLSGNSDALTFNLNGAIERHWKDWQVAAHLNGSYGQSRPAGVPNSQVTALNGRADLRGDRNVSQVVSAFISVGLDTDHVASVESRYWAELGSGITWLDVHDSVYQKAILRTDIGIRYTRENRFQYYPTESTLPGTDLVGPSIGLKFRYGLSKDVYFQEYAELASNVVGTGRLLVNSATKISSLVASSMSLAVTFIVHNDSAPAPNKLPTDTALMVGLDSTF